MIKIVAEKVPLIYWGREVKIAHDIAIKSYGFDNKIHEVIMKKNLARMVINEYFFLIGIFEACYLFWGNSECANTVERKIREQRYEDADFAAAILTRVSKAVCSSCGFCGNALVVCKGEMYMGAEPDLYNKKIGLWNDNFLHCPKCNDIMRSLVVDFV